MSSQRSKFMALVAAFLGWLFDGFEMGLFPLIGKPALLDLLPAATQAARDQWFTDIIAVFLVGAATGGVLFGWLGDKMGRVKAMTLAIFTYAIFTGLGAFVKDPTQFAILRFVASLGMGGEWSLGVALVNELWAGQKRTWIAGMIGAASNIGFLLTGILSLTFKAFLLNITHLINSMGLSENVSTFLLSHDAWRLLAVSGALPALINFFILIFVPESHKWEEEKNAGKTSHWVTSDLWTVGLASVAVLGIIFVWSPLWKYSEDTDPWALRVALPAVLTLIGLAVALWGYLHPVRRYVDRSSQAHDAIPGALDHVFGKLLLGAGLAGVALLGTWGSAQPSAKWASGLLPQGSTTHLIEYTVIALALGAIAITLITPFVADIMGRRVTYTILCAASLASALAFFKLNTPFPSSEVPFYFYISAFLLGGITASFYGFFPLYFPELFPTSVRATAQGFCFNFGRVIAAVGSLQLGNLTKFLSGGHASGVAASGNAYCILCAVYVVGMILVWFCPETKGKALV